MNNLILFNLLVFLAIFPLVSLTENVTFQNVSIKVIIKELFNTRNYGSKVEDIVNLTRSNYLMDAVDGIWPLYYREVRIENQSISVIYENVFEDLDLTILSIRNCDTFTIEKNAFVNVSKLEEFIMQNTNLKTVSKGVFNTVPVKSLDLAYNQINVIELGAFAGLTHIKSLVLRGNRLTEIKRGIFDDMRSLKSLDLGFNFITSVEDGSFESLSDLRVLRLDGNQLKEVNAEIFGKFIPLKQYVNTYSLGIYSVFYSSLNI